MRSGEILGLKWGQVDLAAKIVTVGKAKTPTGTGRQIPMNDELALVIAALADWHRWKFGALSQDHYIFPFGSNAQYDATRHTTTMKKAWASVREDAGVQCRIHDLRHTAITNMAENGVPEGTMLAIAGHMSRAMLERYSHIRLQAKRSAVESLNTGANAFLLRTDQLKPTAKVTELVQ